MCILFHFFQVGVYIGIASRIGLKKVVNTPLRDLTNVHQGVDFQLLAGWRENLFSKNKQFNAWQAALSAGVFVLCQTTMVCHNNFVVSKVITFISG